MDLEFSEDALKSIARKAMERETGARGLRGILENLLRRAMFDLPTETDVVSCVVEEAAVEGREPLHFIRREGGEEEGLRAASGE